MKNILIIRSANLAVMDKLFDYLYQKVVQLDNKLFCLVQESALSTLQSKYPEITYIINSDGFFDIKKFKKNKKLLRELKNQKYEEVYIPSSTAGFESFLDILLIVSKLKYRRIVFYSCSGEMICQRLNWLGLKIEEYFGTLIHFLKVVLAVIILSLFYFVTFPYYFLKNRLLY